MPAGLLPIGSRSILSDNRVVRVDGRDLKLSNLGKVLWPDEGITKAEVIRYYAQVAAYMLPFLKDRPLMIQRYPNGIQKDYFVQKHFPTLPTWIRRIRTKSEKDQKAEFILCNDMPTLIWLGNLAALEINQMLARSPALTKHDIILIDLDPHYPATFRHARTVAVGLAAVLERLKLEFLVKTSGAEGLHFFVPIEPTYSVGKIRRFVHALGRLVEKADPKLATVSTRPARKTGRVYIDFLQNGLGKTITAPFSVRALPKAPVSFPLTEHELHDHRLTPEWFTVRTAPRRLKHMKRKHYLSELSQDLKPALQRLGVAG